VIEIHTRGTHRDHALQPDLVVFDLDPSPGVDAKEVVQAALDVREVLSGLGLESFVKTTGGKGYHIHVPIEPRYSWDEVKEFSHTVARYLEQKNPRRFVSTVSKAKRRGKIFIDYLRNGYGATFVSPYTARARAGAPIAMPIEWKDIARTRPSAFTLKKLLKDPSPLRRDPWPGYAECRQKLDLLELRKKSAVTRPTRR